MKFLILIILIIISSSSIAQVNQFGEFKSCGEYDVAGTFKINEAESRIEYIVFAGSKSELRIKLKRNDEAKSAPYINTPSLIRAIFVKPIDKQAGEFEIISVKARMPNPILGARDSGFVLIKNKKCL
ncbi:MAG: hypothetical protein Q7U04_13770 [Bacteriovorax sp.]|nr:hypothetical protein [Bacteriovorax sp.]